MDVKRINELGVAGPIDQELSALLERESFDLDDFWSIGIAGPVSPTLLRAIAQTGPRRVSDSVHSILAGPVDPDHLERILAIGIDKVHAATWSTGRAPFDDAADLLRSVEHIAER